MMAKKLHKLRCFALTWATGLCGRSIYSTALLVDLHEQIFYKDEELFKYSDKSTTLRVQS